MFPGFRLVAASFLLASTLFLACSTDPTTPVPHPVPVVPVADSPAHAVDLFRWANENRSFDSYRTLFTDDFVFAFAALDSAGNPFRTDGWTRDQELLSFQHLAIGGGAEPRASVVTLVLDRQLRVVADPRPGKDTTTHKQVVSQCNLTVQSIEGRTTNVNGKLALYLVRGDVASLPADLGRAPDPTLWYVERWEDQTFAPTSLSTVRIPVVASQPTGNSTWGRVKATYLPTAPASAAIAPRP